MVSIEAFIKKLSTQLGQLRESTKRQDKGKAINDHSERINMVTALGGAKQKGKKVAKETPFVPDDELEEFFQVFEEEVRLLEEEKEGRMKVDIVKEDKNVVEKDINLIMRIDALKKERDEALKIQLRYRCEKRLRERACSMSEDNSQSTLREDLREGTRTMEEFIEEGMTDFEQLRWLSDHATMETGTMEELEDEVINMLVWASGESHMEEESEEVPDKGSIPSSSSSPKLEVKPLPSTL
ncbi:hypothetical protein Q3G72_013517 [Acer saccharum]|nr:hypothetical protein Q3G72_013517 [Acer saccharum]